MKNNAWKQTQIINAIFSSYAPVKTVIPKANNPYSAFVKSFFTSRKQL